MESLLNAPNDMDIWKMLCETIAQHNDKEKGRYPLNFNHCLIDELKKRGIINDEMYDRMNRDVYRKSFGQLYKDMDHVHGSGIWSAIARKMVGAASRGIAGITTKEVANKAENAILDGTNSAIRKRSEKIVDNIINKKKGKRNTNLDNIPLGGI